MLSRLSYILASVLIFICMEIGAAAASQPDSVKMAALNLKLEEYLKAISLESLDVQKQECDFIIGSTSDSLVRTAVARKVLSSYMDSPLMGAEAVAIHLLDNWFLNGRVSMPSEMDLLNARIYADFNRQSLVGMMAPEISMQSMDGRDVTLFGEGKGASGASGSGRHAVLYFYDTDCSKCKIETILLRNMLEDNDYPVDLVAVYAGDDRQAWESYAHGQLAVDSDKVNVIHLWDPELDSDFQRKYGVLQTPRMFLLRPDGVILGRGLDSEALYAMLRGIFSQQELNYGSEESAALFDGILAAEDGKGPDRQRVCDLVDYISSGTVHKGDTLMFRQLSGDLLYYLATRSGEGIKEGLKYLIDENINGCPEAWDSQDDSLKVVGFAAIMDDLLSKAMPGTLVPDLKVPGEYVTSRKSKTGDFRLDRLRGGNNIIMFYTEGCEICKAEKAAIRNIAAGDRSVRALFINVDVILADNPSLADALFDSFDLSVLPYIVLSDRKGKVMRRYLSYR